MSEIKPVLRQMIDNNKPHWRPATIQGAHKQLDEYEAKAKAWDALMAEIDRITDEAAVKGLPPKTTLVNKVIAVTMAKKNYESGESE